MARISDQQQQVKYQFILELWDMIKRFDTPEDTDEYWNALIETSGRIATKYEDMTGGADHMYRLVTMAFITAKERQMKARRAA